MRPVLVGCGHGHVEVVRRFALYPEPELVLTLISTSPLETCFGKLPGLVAGHYGPGGNASRTRGHVEIRSPTSVSPCTRSTGGE